VGYRPFGYYSIRFKGRVSCLRSVATAAESVLACSDIVAMSPLTIHVPHAVHAIITQARMAHLTPARLLGYQNILLTMSHVTLKRCTILNPANLLPTAEDSEDHDCDLKAVCLAKASTTPLR
jgi:hypothetical protein